MKARLYLFGLILAGLLLAGTFYQGMSDARAEAPLEEAIIGTWKFSQDGYYFGFDEAGRLCYGRIGEDGSRQALVQQIYIRGRRGDGNVSRWA